MAKTPQQMADNWNSAMRNPQTAAKYKAGIQGTTVNPMQQAASPQAQALYLAKVTDAVQSGRMAAKLNAVPMSTWQNNAANIGSQNLTSGAAKGQAKVQNHFQRWAPIYAQASAAAQAVPKDGSINSAIARVTAAIQVLMAAKGS